MKKRYYYSIIFFYIFSIYALAIQLNGQSFYGANISEAERQESIEFRLIPDLTVSRIVNPQSAQIPSCQNLDSVQIIVEIENPGSSPAWNFPVRVQINNSSVFTYQVMDTIGLNEIKLITFQNTVSLTGGNFHSFKAWTDLSNDANRLNDTSIVDISVYAGNSSNLPLFEDFDQFSSCPTVANCSGTTCNLGGGWINQTNNIFDDIDWRTNSGSTASGGTGPTSDVSGNGNYLYIEASGVCSFNSAYLTSPCINLSNAQQPELSFWYHMLGVSIGELHVDVLENGIWHEDVIAPWIGQQGTTWLQQTVDLSSFSGNIITIRFRGSTGADFRSDIAIDEISVHDNYVYAIDASLSKLLSPTFSTKEDCILEDSINVSVIIQNSGFNAIGNLPMHYSLNGGIIVSEIYNNVLQSGEIDTFTFSNAFSLNSAGNYSLKIWQDYAPDLNSGNDTLYSSISITAGTMISVPFTQNFDGMMNCSTFPGCEATVCTLSGGWKNYANGVDSDDIDWRVHSGATPSANTGPVNDQNLGTSAGKYLYMEVSGGCNNRTAILESPCIDLRQSYSPQLKIWYHMFGQDIGELHLDVLLGDNWFNDFVPPIIGDQGNSWQDWNIDLILLAGNVIKFRLRGISAFGFRGDIAVDNISINDNFSPASADFSFTQPNCTGQSITFTDISSGTALNYFWDFGQNAVPASANGSGPHNVTFFKSGLDSVKLIVSNVAGSDTNQKFLLIDTIPSVDFSWNVNGDTVNFINQSSNASSFMWDFGDSTTANSLQATHVYSNPGIYTVTLTVNNGCGVNIISKDITIGVVGVFKSGESTIKVYPNPSYGLLTIEGFTIDDLQNLEMTISDLKGRPIENFEHSVYGKKVILDIHELPKGLYLLRLKNDITCTILKIDKR